MTELDLAAPRLAAMSRELITQVARAEEHPTLRTMVANAVHIVPAAEHCGVLMRRRRGRLDPEGATSTLAQDCDDAQVRLGEGPAWDVVADAECVASGETGTDVRWREWGPAAAGVGIRSVLAVRLASDSGVIGAMTMYSSQSSAFSTADVDLALIFTATAVQALNGAREAAGLRTAIPTRHLIGVAQGVLMARYGLSMDQAFQVLRRYSNDHNLKLRDVAARIVADGDLPTTRAEPHALS